MPQSGKILVTRGAAQGTHQIKTVLARIFALKKQKSLVPKALVDDKTETQIASNSPKMDDNTESLSSFYSGLSGLILPIPKYLFPAPFENASRLTYYASHFNSIEINSSFYKIPQGATVAKWASSVPQDFKFTFKLWREITHVKGLNFNPADVERFYKVIDHVQEKKGCLLVQFPPGLKIGSIAQITKLLTCINEYNTSAWKIAVEFRNKSWHDDSIYQLLTDFKACLVIQDKVATPSISHELDFVYIRFHGPKGNYRESYSEDFLSEYATYLQEWISEDKEVYVYFNNTMGDAFGNLKALNELVH